MAGSDELVTVQIGPGRWQKMTRKQAADNGYEVDEPETEVKTRAPADKARKTPARKAPATKKQARRS